MIDYTKAAREALQLKGDKYPADLTGLAVDTYGRQVQLRHGKKIAKAMMLNIGRPSLMRLYTRCDCGRWISSGRLTQHLDATGHGGISHRP